MHADLKLPRKLRQARAARGLSQRDVAQLAGVDVSWLCRVENGQGMVPTDASVQRIAAALGLDKKTTEELDSLARSDRVVRLSAQEVPRSAPLVAAALEASFVLDDAEFDGLSQVMEEIIQSKQRLTRLSAASNGIQERRSRLETRS